MISICFCAFVGSQQSRVWFDCITELYSVTLLFSFRNANSYTKVWKEAVRSWNLSCWLRCTYKPVSQKSTHVGSFPSFCICRKFLSVREDCSPGVSPL